MEGTGGTTRRGELERSVREEVVGGGGRVGRGGGGRSGEERRGEQEREGERGG